jgi:hypothetical protein
MEHLAERQQAFAAALLDPGLAVPDGLVGPDGEQSARRFAVYKNNVFVGLTEALRAGFPCVARIVGDEFFMAMARVFAAGTPPSSPVLLHYGAGFPEFIEAFPPAASLPYLADVARVERAATEAYHASDATALTADAFAGIPPEKSPSLRFRLHPSVRMVRSRFPAYTIWRMNLPDGTPAAVDLSESQDMIVLRPDAEVDARQVSTVSYDFVSSLGCGMTLSQAMEAALAADPQFDLSAHLRELIRMGAFAGFDLLDEENDDE